MSRIHEALKKAEQERAANQGGTQLEPAPVAAVESAVMPEMASHRVPDPVAVAAMMPAFGSPFSVDTMLARCAQMEWKPDLGTMLFMNGDDNKRGTEEFRTLRSRLYHMREKMS